MFQFLPVYPCKLIRLYLLSVGGSLLDLLLLRLRRLFPLGGGRERKLIRIGYKVVKIRRSGFTVKHLCFYHVKIAQPLGEIPLADIFTHSFGYIFVKTVGLFLKHIQLFGCGRIEFGLLHYLTAGTAVTMNGVAIFGGVIVVPYIKLLAATAALQKRSAVYQRVYFKIDYSLEARRNVYLFGHLYH